MLAISIQLPGNFLTCTQIQSLCIFHRFCFPQISAPPPLPSYATEHSHHHQSPTLRHPYSPHKHPKTPFQARGIADSPHLYAILQNFTSKPSMYFLTPRPAPPGLDRQQPPVVRHPNPNRKPRRLFTNEEDKKLVELVNQYGANAWTLISDRIPGRTSRQCKERYFTYLSPGVKKAPWTDQEDTLLFQKVQELGQRWSDIARYFDGRTPNSIKNRWHLHLRGRHSKGGHMKMMQCPAPHPGPCVMLPIQIQVPQIVAPVAFVEHLPVPVLAPPPPPTAVKEGPPRPLLPSVTNMPFPTLNA